MKRLVYILLILCSLGAQAQQETYRRYASRPGLLVALAHNYQLDKDNAIDALIIQAETDEAWEQLQREFLTYVPDSLQGDARIFCVKQRRDPTKAALFPYKYNEICWLTASMQEHFICLFYINNARQFRILAKNQARIALKGNKVKTIEVQVQTIKK